MSALTNDALLEALAAEGFAKGPEVWLSLNDGSGTAAPTTQGSRPAVGAVVHVIANGTVNGAITLPSIFTNDAPPMMWVINSGTQSLRIFPFSGDSIDGAANTAVNVTAGNAGFFYKIPVQVKRGGPISSGNRDWRFALLD